MESNLTRDFVTQVSRDDFLGLLTKGREQGLKAPTVTRRLTVALMALRNSGAVINLKKGDWPKITEKSVQTYNERELEKFFTGCQPAERLLFETSLCTGFRKREVNTLTWNDVDFHQRTILVQPKPGIDSSPRTTKNELYLSLPRSLKRYRGGRRPRQNLTWSFPLRRTPNGLSTEATSRTRIISSSANGSRCARN